MSTAPRFSWHQRGPQRFAGGWIRCAWRVIAGIATGTTLTAVLAATVPGLVGMHSIIVTGGSMGHNVPIGSIAVTRTITMQDVKRGDVIAFSQPGAGATVIHRVVDIQDTEEGLVATTKGDANAAADSEPIALTGSGDKVVYSVAYLGYALVFARTPAGVALLMIAGALWIARVALTTTRRHATNATPA